MLSHKPDVAANCNGDGVGRAIVGVVLLVWFFFSGGRLCRKPLPEDVCFNADSVPVEAVMLISPPCYSQDSVHGGCVMKTYSCGLQRASGRRTEHRGGPQEANTACFLSLQCQPFYTPTLRWPIWGGGHLVFRVDCIKPHITSTHMHSHISAAHQILQLDEEYQWEQWASGQTMDSASRPARQPRISWLIWQKNIISPSGCPQNKKTTFLPKRRACWKLLALVSFNGM